ncbi:uncharacterized protein LOC125583136 [Brassica napus]|uniref:uncharacterized protein LOC125583136 n=1 Tax=Brassica napus TaxID=3708 RepID=UPI00207AD4BF|nr:uncharacterized protein LOC125583136 [Brassica napus]
MDEISFMAKEQEKVLTPHHDALVISLTVANCLVKRILVDNGSSGNIIFLAAYKDLGLEESALTRRITPLIGFSGEVKQTAGEVNLPVYAEGIKMSTKFLIVDCDSSYNMILGRPWIHGVGAIPSTLHQMVKFPTSWDIKVIRADQEYSRSCYQTTLRERPRSYSNYRASLRLITPRNQRQTRRKFAPERDAIINDEVKSLLGVGFIREVQYPEWLANVVVVKKKNGKWRVSIDFTDLNKSCPKDPFPLPHIDKLVDSTVGHPLMSFMDTFSGYNQILMHPKTRRKHPS